MLLIQKECWVTAFMLRNSAVWISAGILSKFTLSKYCNSFTYIFLWLQVLQWHVGNMKLIHFSLLGGFPHCGEQPMCGKILIQCCQSPCTPPDSYTLLQLIKKQWNSCFGGGVWKEEKHVHVVLANNTYRALEIVISKGSTPDGKNWENQIDWRSRNHELQGEAEGLGIV